MMETTQALTDALLHVPLNPVINVVEVLLHLQTLANSVETAKTWELLLVTTKITQTEMAVLLLAQ